MQPMNEGLLPTESVVEGFNSYTTQQVERLQGLASFLAEALPQVEDIETCNERFRAIGREDLVMTEQAPMWQISIPEQVPSECNNFTPKFTFFTGSYELEEESFLGLPPEVNHVPIPITEEQLLGLIDGSFKFENHPNNHSRKASFMRMFILFPDFTKNLVMTISTPERQSYATKSPELFVAYQLMSRLVDLGDEYVMRAGDDGQITVHDRYLCS